MLGAHVELRPHPTEVHRKMNINWTFGQAFAMVAQANWDNYTCLINWHTEFLKIHL